MSSIGTSTRRTDPGTVWRPVLPAALGLALLAGQAGVHAQQGTGLKLSSDQTAQFGPHWSSRVGLVANGAVESTLNSPYALAPHPQEGLKIHSLHLLSDYHFAGGFRATAGLVRGATHLPWWPDTAGSSLSAGGLNLSLQRLDLLGTNGVHGQGMATDAPNRTVPYVGAGYTGRLSEDSHSDYGVWHFNADLGLISLNSENIGRVGRVLQGEQKIDELLREMRLRPVVKFSVKYAF